MVLSKPLGRVDSQKDRKACPGVVGTQFAACRVRAHSHTSPVITHMAPLDPPERSGSLTPVMSGRFICTE